MDFLFHLFSIKSIPGLIASLLGLGVPIVSFAYLRLFPDPRVKTALDDTETRGVMALYLQIATVISAITILTVLSVMNLYIGVGGILRALSALSAVGLFVLIFGIFVAAERGKITLDPFLSNDAPTFLGIRFAFNSLLVWIRIALIILGILFGLFTE